MSTQHATLAIPAAPTDVRRLLLDPLALAPARSLTTSSSTPARWHRLKVARTEE